MALPSDNKKSSPPIDNKVELRLEIIDSIAALEAKADAWNDLVNKAAYSTPVFSHAWISTYLKHRLKPNETWKCFFVYDKNKLVGVLPIIISNKKILGFKYNSLQMPMDWHTVSVDFLSASTFEKEVISLILDEIKTTIPDWCLLKLTRIPDYSPTLNILKDEINNAFIISEFDSIGSFIPIKSSYKDFHSKLNKKFSKKLQYVKRKFEKSHKIGFLFDSESYSIPDYFENFLRIEMSGKKGEGGAINLEVSLIAFYKELISKLSDLGWLERHYFKLDDKLVALHMALNFKKTLFMYKRCFDDAYYKYSPGNLFFEQMAEYAFNSGDFDEINLLSHLPVHDQWRVKTRSYYNIYIYPKKFTILLKEVFPRFIWVKLKTTSVIKKLRKN